MIAVLRDRLRSARGPSVVAIGTFDGVHRGHRELLHRARRLARARGLRTIAVTMHPRPEVLFAGAAALPDICSLDERIRRLRAAGADDVIVVPFDFEVAAMTADEFCRELSEHLDCRALYVGEDFALGKGRAGTPARLRELGYEVHTLSLVDSGAGAGKASSTNVRKAITRGLDPAVALAAA